MYDLKDYEPYTLRKHLGDQPVLAWSKKNGYHFLPLHGRLVAMLDGEDFKIVGVLKEEVKPKTLHTT